MAALEGGGNVLSRQPTGSGKSWTYFLPAVARWAAVARARAACADAATRAKLPLPPLTLVAAPFRALCEDAEQQANQLLAQLYGADPEVQMLPTVDVLGAQLRARALFVDRSGEFTGGAWVDGGDGSASGNASGSSGEAAAASPGDFRSLRSTSRTRCVTGRLGAGSLWQQNALHVGL